jgi:broad specificity phosphatase PhoE
MTLPIDLVLVRHGQSEGNAAKRLSEAGDHSAFTSAFRERHSASFRLTDRGRKQAQRAGDVLRQEFVSNHIGSIAASRPNMFGPWRRRLCCNCLARSGFAISI